MKCRRVVLHALSTRRNRGANRVVRRTAAPANRGGYSQGDSAGIPDRMKPPETTALQLRGKLHSSIACKACGASIVYLNTDLSYSPVIHSFDSKGEGLDNNRLSRFKNRTPQLPKHTANGLVCFLGPVENRPLRLHYFTKIMHRGLAVKYKRPVIDFLIMRGDFVELVVYVADNFFDNILKGDQTD